MAATNERREFPILQYRQGQISEITDVVAAEYDLAIQVNGKEFITLLCTPRSLEDLVAGFLFSEGVIHERDDLQSLSIDEERKLAEVTLRNKDAFILSGDKLYAQKTVTTACGKGRSMLYVADFDTLAERLDNTFTLKADKVLALMTEFNRKSQLFLDTGGVHSCALSDGNELLSFEEDIGRHNALDKILGHAMMHDIALENKIVLTSGRISTEIVAKVARRGIPVIVSRSAPTSAAIEQAQALGMTLIGFARGSKFNVYTNFSCLERD